MTDGVCPTCGPLKGGRHAMWCEFAIPLGPWVDEACCKGQDMFDLTDPSRPIAVCQLTLDQALA